MLPDWWDDKAADVGSGMAVLEGYVARMTGLTIQALRGEAPLKVAPLSSVRFKKRADTEADEVAPAAAIAEQVARGLSLSVQGVPPFKGLLTAAEVRRHIRTKRSTVNLLALIDFAWDHGIIVAHMAELPDGSKKFDGLAMFVGERPVLILGSRRDSSPWLAFDLAHEIGHVLLGHVTAGSAPMSDLALKTKSEDPVEMEADRFGLDVLTGLADSSFHAVYGLTGERLARVAQEKGPAAGIDPGVLALVYGWSAGRIPAAQNALKILKETSGAHEAFADGVRRHLKEDLSESLRMLADIVTES